MKTYLNKLFNWKRYPAGIFFVAAPLAIIGLGAHLIYAILMAVAGNYGYLAIFVAGIALLIFGLWPVRHFIKDFLIKE